MNREADNEMLEELACHSRSRRGRNSSTRKAKIENGGGRVVKEKFQEQRAEHINSTPLRPMNPMQAQYMEHIRSKKCVVATGFAGTSKSYIPTVMACDMWLKGEINRIYLTRPNISNSKSLGFFSGSHIEKMTLWLLPVLNTMYERLGRSVVEIAIKNGDIQFVPMETIKGSSFGSGTFVIVDEAEDLTVDEVKNVLTRQGGCKMVLCGDKDQSALKSNSGLAYIKNMCEKYAELSDFTGFVDFNRPSDIVRSPECKAWLLAFRREEQNGN